MRLRALILLALAGCAEKPKEQVSFCKDFGAAMADAGWYCHESKGPPYEVLRADGGKTGLFWEPTITAYPAGWDGGK